MVRRTSPVVGRAAVAAWREGSREPADVAPAVRYTLEEFAARAPGRSVELRVPPLGAVQCIEGTAHRRGTPPAVVETDADTWLALVTGQVTWDEALASGAVRASGERTDLGPLLPLALP